MIPTASSLGPEIVDVYDALFRAEGAAEVDRGAAAEPRGGPGPRARASGSTRRPAIFMTGGNQLKLTSIICGTPVGDAIVAAHQRGVVVAGTSAGASIQSSHMVAFGVGGATPKQRMTQVAAGLGLLGSTVIDQHFDQRNRYGRLLMIVSQSPSLLGLGVDEDTAAVVETDRRTATSCCGSSGAARSRSWTRPRWSRTPTRRSAPRPSWPAASCCTSLPQGARFDLTTRRLLPVDPAVDPLEELEIAEAGRDLRQMARDIAAGDVSPTSLRRRLRRSPRRPAGHPRTTPDGGDQHDRAAHPRPRDPRDPRLPRRQRLVLRQGDPPRGRPRLAGEVPDQHAPGLHRQPPRDAPGPARALLLPRPARRLRRAARRGHLARATSPSTPRSRSSRSSATTSGAARPGRSRASPGTTTSSSGTSTSRSASRRRELAVRLVNHLVAGRPGARLGRRARVVHPARRAHGVRSLDAGDPRRGGLPRHPVDPAQPVLPGPARPGRPRQADPGHDDVGDLGDRGRHRLRQGPDHPAARCGRPAGPQAGVGAHRGPGGARGRADRLPRRGQAAGRQPRPRRLPRPDERGRRPRGVRDRQGASPGAA